MAGRGSRNFQYNVLFGHRSNNAACTPSPRVEHVPNIVLVRCFYGHFPCYNLIVCRQVFRNEKLNDIPSPGGRLLCSSQVRMCGAVLQHHHRCGVF